jgi:hypothetical protein
MAALLLIVALALPQALPSAYAKEFENDWVRVTRVIYPPHTEIPIHGHTDYAAAYVYLNDAPPVIFKHDNNGFGNVTRRATTAGGVRLYRGVPGETHGVLNDGDVKSEFLRVEFKTEEAPDPRTLIGRFASIAVPAGENLEKMQFENAQMRMTRIVIAPGQSVTLAAAPGVPSLFIRLMSGKSLWVGADTPITLGNDEAASQEYLRFELKTAPKNN